MKSSFLSQVLSACLVFVLVFSFACTRRICPAYASMDDKKVEAISERMVPLLVPFEA